ncbi:MAG: DUF998 domain-containing protein [Acidimicrobiia bacterium]|nr:DUF998 domain-containing protein [Acidimicrobiia bacterium]
MPDRDPFRLDPAVGVLVLLGASVLALAIAPLAMPDSYSWVSNTTSESGAQGVPGAWVARLGFLFFGLAVIWLDVLARKEWRQPGAALHMVFGVCMVVVAAFSVRPWDPDAPFDATEDLMHSVAATTMGFAFASGVVAVALRRNDGRPRFTALDVVAVGAAVLIPLSMATWGDVDGIPQRAMFLVAFTWYGWEALRRSRSRRSPRARRASASRTQSLP